MKKILIFSILFVANANSMNPKMRINNRSFGITGLTREQIVSVDKQLIKCILSLDSEISKNLAISEKTIDYINHEITIAYSIYRIDSFKLQKDKFDQIMLLYKNNRNEYCEIIGKFNTMYKNFLESQKRGTTSARYYFGRISKVLKTLQKIKSRLTLYNSSIISLTQNSMLPHIFFECEPIRNLSFKK